MGCTGPEGRRVPAHPRLAGTPPDGRGTGHVLGDVVGALLLQVLQDPSQAVRCVAADDPARAVAGRHRRQRGGCRHRAGLRHHLQVRVAQPPVLCGALPRRSHRGRRYCARHPRHGCPSDRSHGWPALRSAGRSRHRPCAAGHRRRCGWLRQLPGPSEHRRRGLLRPQLLRQPAGQRAVRRRHAPRRPEVRQGDRCRQQGHPLRCRYWRRRHRRGVHPGVRDVRRQQTVEASGGAGRRPVHGEAAHRVHPGALRRRRGRGDPGPGRRRYLLRHQ